MTDVPVRELRNNTAAVVRRVQAGEDITITVHGTPVARVVPVSVERRRVMPREELVGWLQSHPADPGFREDVRALSGEMTDQTGVEW